MSAEARVQDRRTGAKGVVLNDRNADIAIVKFDDWPEPTWAEWKDLA
jgi:hypothetical protein